MKQKCVKQVSKALGRPVDRVEAQAIEHTLLRALREDAKDRGVWNGRSPGERVIAAAWRVSLGQINDAQIKRDALRGQVLGRPPGEGQRYNQLAGERSATADPTALQRAQEMRAEGQSEKRIWRETGWWFNEADGKWRYEIDDTHAELRALFERGEDGVDRFNGQLDEVLDFPELYAAYPALASIDVRIELNPLAAEGGQARNDGGRDLIEVAAEDERSALGILLHEVQHFVQYLEDFAHGGTPEAVLDNPTLAAAYQARVDAVWAGLAEQLAADGKTLDDLQRLLPVQFEQKRKEIEGRAALWVYERLLGEIEARNVENRRGQSVRGKPGNRRLSPKLRALRAPGETVDTPLAEGIDPDGPAPVVSFRSNARGPDRAPFSAEPGAPRLGMPRSGADDRARGPALSNEALAALVARAAEADPAVRRPDDAGAQGAGRRLRQSDGPDAGPSGAGRFSSDGPGALPANDGAGAWQRPVDYDPYASIRAEDMPRIRAELATALRSEGAYRGGEVLSRVQTLTDEQAIRAWRVLNENGPRDLHNFVLGERRNTPLARQMRGETGEVVSLNTASALPDGSSPQQRSGEVVKGETFIPAGGVFSDPGVLVSLFERADRSTPFHEFGHVYLETMKAYAARPDAPQALRDDYAAVLRWLGAKDGEDFTTPQHEKFARGFEAYLREGRAPQPALQRFFDAFRDWLTAIYKSVQDLDVELTPEIRGVFDRLVGEPDAVAGRVGDSVRSDPAAGGARPGARAGVPEPGRADAVPRATGDQQPASVRGADREGAGAGSGGSARSAPAPQISPALLKRDPELKAIAEDLAEARAEVETLQRQGVIEDAEARAALADLEAIEKSAARPELLRAAMVCLLHGARVSPGAAT